LDFLISIAGMRVRTCKGLTLFGSGSLFQGLARRTTSLHELSLINNLAHRYCPQQRLFMTTMLLVK